MSYKLIEHNEDLRRLRDKGYNVERQGVYLIVRDIPYVDEHRQAHSNGILITELTLDGNKTISPRRHQIYFIGDCPCDQHGVRINAIRPNNSNQRITDALTASFEFSNKPSTGKYADHFQKVANYAALISGPAATIDSSLNPMTFKVAEPELDDSPFNYLDTASAGAGINIIAKRLAEDSVAIVGLGGTGSYVLDFLAKTPVREIHLYDSKKFSSHNAFRAPGAATIDDLHTQFHKVEYFHKIYSNMHRGIIPHVEDINKDNAKDLSVFNTVFLCMDAGPGKRAIVDELDHSEVLVIDAGMGLYVRDEEIHGLLQVTTSTSRNREQARRRMALADTDEENEYDRNIQVADLNAQNALLAIQRWKKALGFYHSRDLANFTTLTVASNMMVNDDLDG